MNDLITQILKERDIYLKRGLELASYPQQSPAVEEVFEAFSQAQGEFPAVTKAQKGYGYRYADLATILATVRPHLSKYGLHFTQYITRDSILHTRVGHKSGQYFESQYKMPTLTEEAFARLNKKTTYMQELGSRRTYIRRYEALAILGLNPDGEDTNGN